jgi:hypothetical protein
VTNDPVSIEDAAQLLLDPTANVQRAGRENPLVRGNAPVGANEGKFSARLPSFFKNEGASASAGPAPTDGTAPAAPAAGRRIVDGVLLPKAPLGEDADASARAFIEDNKAEHDRYAAAERKRRAAGEARAARHDDEIEVISLTSSSDDDEPAPPPPPPPQAKRRKLEPDDDAGDGWLAGGNSAAPDAAGGDAGESGIGGGTLAPAPAGSSGGSPSDDSLADKRRKALEAAERRGRVLAATTAEMRARDA